MGASFVFVSNFLNSRVWILIRSIGREGVGLDELMADRQQNEQCSVLPVTCATMFSLSKTLFGQRSI